MLTDRQIGQRLKMLRTDHGYTQAEVGQRMKKRRSYAAISDIERGKTKLNMGELQELARMYGYYAWQVLYEDSEGELRTSASLAPCGSVRG